MPLPVQVPWYQADDDTEQAGVTLCIQLREKVAKLAQELLLAHGAAAADSCACCPRTPLRRCAAAANVAAARDHREGRTVAVLGTALEQTTCAVTRMPRRSCRSAGDGVVPRDGVQCRQRWSDGRVREQFSRRDRQVAEGSATRGRDGKVQDGYSCEREGYR